MIAVIMIIKSICTYLADAFEEPGHRDVGVLAFHCARNAQLEETLGFCFLVRALLAILVRCLRRRLGRWQSLLAAGQPGLLHLIDFLPEVLHLQLKLLRLCLASIDRGPLVRQSLILRLQGLILFLQGVNDGTG